MAETTVAKTDEIITAQEAAGTKVAVILQHGLHRRDEFRGHSCISGIVELVVVVAGSRGYVFAVQQLIRTLGELSAMTLIKCVRRCRSPYRDRESSSRMAV
jgi:3-dehydroquinate dehydratase